MAHSGKVGGLVG